MLIYHSSLKLTRSHVSIWVIDECHGSHTCVTYLVNSIQRSWTLVSFSKLFTIQSLFFYVLLLNRRYCSNRVQNPNFKSFFTSQDVDSKRESSFSALNQYIACRKEWLTTVESRDSINFLTVFISKSHLPNGLSKPKCSIWISGTLRRTLS